MDDKIKFIENLLKDDSDLKKYIEQIEHDKIEIPVNLENKINENIKIIEKIEKENVNKVKTNTHSTYRFTDFIKVACFAWVSVLSWEFGVRQIDNINKTNTKDNIEIIREEHKENKINITEKLGNFMMDEIIKGGKEK